MPRSWSVLDCFFSKQSKFQILFFDWSAGQPFKNSFFFDNDLKHKEPNYIFGSPKIFGRIVGDLVNFLSKSCFRKAEMEAIRAEGWHNDDLGLLFFTYFEGGKLLLLSKSWQKNPFFILHIFFQPLNSESNSCHLP